MNVNRVLGTLLETMNLTMNKVEQNLNSEVYFIVMKDNRPVKIKISSLSDTKQCYSVCR